MEGSHSSSLNVKMEHSSKYCLKITHSLGLFVLDFKNSHLISLFNGNTIDQKWKKTNKKSLYLN